MGRQVALVLAEVHAAPTAKSIVDVLNGACPDALSVLRRVMTQEMIKSGAQTKLATECSYVDEAGLFEASN